MSKTMTKTRPTRTKAKAEDPVEQVANRERWLNTAAKHIVAQFGDAFRAQFGEDGFKHLEKTRISTGFPSVRGLSGKVIGECWTSKASADESHHIFISPLLEEPVKVIATLAHELVHAADDGKNHHKGPFTRAVRAMGLEGKPTATVAGEEFTAWAKELIDEIGPYPHVGLKPTLQIKPQKTYMLKLECPGCGCIVRMTQKWLDEAGAPFCGTRSHVDPVTGQTTDRRFRMEESN